ncbi:MAG: hypothetical protein QW445_07635 [Candidatus Bathyarchaeia archaeon]
MKGKLAIVSVLILALSLIAVYPCSASGVTVNLSQSTGPIGTVVTVSGKLENPGAQFKIFWHYIMEWNGTHGYLTTGYAEGFDYTAEITVPNSKAGAFYVIVEDEKNHATGYALFTVTPTLTVEPDTAPSGAEVTASGVLIKNSPITLRFYDPVSDVEVNVAETETDGNGSLNCQFTVPLTPEGSYLIRAYYLDMLQAEVSFTVGYEGIKASPSKAPPGAVITVAGGLAITETFTLKIQNDTWNMDVGAVETDKSGHFKAKVTVPLADAGVYELTACKDNATYASTQLEITEPATLSILTNSVINGYALAGVTNMTVSGSNFVANSTVDIYIYSSPVHVASAAAGEDGGFTVTFTVPSEISAGEHTLIIKQDEYEFTVNATVTIHTIKIATYSSEYVGGDVISFRINSTAPFVSNTAILIRIRDVDGVTYAVLSIPEDNFENVDGCWVAPYSAATVPQLMPKNAPRGTWSWTLQCYSSLHPTIPLTYTGKFIVADDATTQIISRLDYLGELIELNNNGILTVETKVGELQLALSDVDAKITAVSNNVASIATSTGSRLPIIQALSGEVTIFNAYVSTTERYCCSTFSPALRVMLGI